MNSLWDIRIFLGLVPKESTCVMELCILSTENISAYVLSMILTDWSS
jgi:hypothetical protein